MRTCLMASTAMLAISVVPAAAQTSIATKQTAPLRTATVKGGAADAITITDKGSVEIAAGTAVTQDSRNAVNNQGTIAIRDANGTTGIAATAGGGGITNSGKITLDETYKPADDDKDGDLDGPFAKGTDRVAIRVTGAYAGDITHAQGGVITVQGNDSAGIRLGDTLTGNLVHNGTTTVTGDRAVGVRTGAVSGNVRLAGTIGATGLNASAARIEGPVSGRLEVQGTLTATGYRSTTLPTSVDKLDADDLLQGGPALLVADNVSGGIIFAVPPRDANASDRDEDKDGIDDAQEGTAVVTSFGAAPAVLVGATDRAVAIGAVAGRSDGFGMVVDGTIQAGGVYKGVAAQALVIGGQGGAVTVAGGLGVAGRVAAVANGASATAIRIGAGATVPQVNVTGTVAANGGDTAQSVATALRIDAGAAVPLIRNAGTIQATAGGADATAIAIHDASGTVRTIENSGVIAATGGLATAGRAVAIDVSAATGGVTIRQSGVAGAAINGDIRFGAGNNTLDIQTGAVAGTVRFGAGDDTMLLAGTSRFAGTADFGGGADVLRIGDTASFRGALANATGLAVNVGGGTLALTAPARVASLAMGAKATLGLTLDGTTRTTPALDVIGAATIEKGATLAIGITSLTGVEGRHIALRAGTLTGADGLALSATSIPFLFKGTLTAAAGQVSIDIARKTTTELGLGAQTAQLYDAAYAALAADTELGNVVLGIADGAVFRRTVDQMLPAQADGTFEMVTMGSRAIARVIADPTGLLRQEGDWGYWIAPAAWQLKTGSVASGGHDISGWGAAGGVERATGIGHFGIALAYLDGRQTMKANANRVNSGQYEAAGYWRGNWGSFAANARISAARVNFDGERRFLGTVGTTQINRLARSDWNGDLLSASGAMSYEMGGERFFVRPVAAIDYYRLSEKAHADQGGGKGFALRIDQRTSDELAGTASLVAGVDFLGNSRNWMGQVVNQTWFRVEFEGGRREILAGALGATTGQFEGGQRFTLDPTERTSGWIGRVRAIGGSYGFRLAGEFNAEERQDDLALSVRGSLLVRF